MRRMSKAFLCTAAIALGSLFVPAASQAQEAVFAEPDGLREYETIYEEFEDAFFSHDESFFNNRTLPRQASWMFGLGFPENEIWKDGRAVHRLYRELYDEQISTTPRIRTPDLVSPFETSLLQTPPSEIGVREFEDAGFRQPIPAPAAPPVTVTPAPTPIPALW
ncbi:MAG: hypothetical protein VKL39_23215 [Leptolyngbyaceae bacterium]|nr:hypothetical protein [Leptolyngbyaceae bacterium]